MCSTGVSETTGLTGSTNATFVLEKEHWASDAASFYAIGRDIEYQEFTLAPGRSIVLSRGDGVDSSDGLSGMPSKVAAAVTPVL